MNSGYTKDEGIRVAASDEERITGSLEAPAFSLEADKSAADRDPCRGIQ